MSQISNLRKRQYSQDFKLRVLREIEAGTPLAQVCRQHQVHANTVRGWRKQQKRQGPRSLQSYAGGPSANGSAADEARIAELERMIGQQAVEIAFLKKPWRASRKRRALCGAMAASDEHAHPL